MPENSTTPESSSNSTSAPAPAPAPLSKDEKLARAMAAGKVAAAKYVNVASGKRAPVGYLVGVTGGNILVRVPRQDGSKAQYNDKPSYVVPLGSMTQEEGHAYGVTICLKHKSSAK